MFALVEVLLVLVVAAVLVYLAYTALRGFGQRTQGGRWEAAHRARGGSTTVVVRKVAPDLGQVLDEHVVAVIADDDPDYDRKFLEAMALARSRAALYESEA